MTHYIQYGKKYHNINQVYNNIRYDSQLEANYAMELDLRIKAKDIKAWERQITLPLEVNGIVVTHYRIDFIIYHNDKTKEYVECKGFPTDLWQLKWKMLEAIMDKEVSSGKVKLTIVK